MQDVVIPSFFAEHRVHIASGKVVSLPAEPFRRAHFLQPAEDFGASVAVYKGVASDIEAIRIYLVLFLLALNAI